jgi:hypothetical protein
MKNYANSIDKDVTSETSICGKVIVCANLRARDANAAH